LQYKAMKTLLEVGEVQGGRQTMGVIRAAVCGMDAEAVEALEALAEAAGRWRVGVVGRFMEDPAVSRRLRELGVAEEVDEADLGRFDRIVIPFDGVVPARRKAWEGDGHRVLDLSSAQVRRAQVALGLLRMEGAQTLVIGRHDDPQSQALSGMGTRVIEDTTDTARLGFSPMFGAVCHTRLSPRRVSWLVQQLRLRYRDARVTFLDTAAPSMRAREQALEKVLGGCDAVVVAGERGEASCEALAEVATRAGKPVWIAGDREDLVKAGFAAVRRVGLTAGGLVPGFAVERMARVLTEWSESSST
jgi:4-hydroxy-3-methylbut-2-en-1-yl diphosphate reductase